MPWPEHVGGPSESGPVEPGPLESATDPITESLARERRPDRAAAETPLRYALAEARELLAHARSDGGFQASLPRALELVRLHPEASDLQYTAARLLMEGADPRAATAWVGIQRRFPTEAEPFRMVVRLTCREQGEEAARSLVIERFPDHSSVTDEAGLLSLGFGLEELGKPDEAEESYHRAVRLFPKSRLAWRRLLALKEARGGVLSAQHAAAQAMTSCGGDYFVQAHARLTKELQVLETFSPETAHRESPRSVKALDAILTDVLGRRRPISAAPRQQLGSTMMITGSLGSGGAERQLIATVVGLQRAMVEGRSIDGCEIVGPLKVACRTLSSRQDNDFFLDTLKAEQVPVTEYGRLAPLGGNARFARARPWLSVVDYLPPRMKEGVLRLVEYIRYEAPDVIQIWQDGMVLAAGLAALIAGTPRIVLSVRTLPPSDRISRWKVELEPIYRALLSSQGVALTANSTLAARRYEDWLGLPKGAVPVIHNGVERLSEQPAAGDEAQWSDFIRRTSDAEFTLGGVMRLDQNKRPLEWLTVAERLHRRHPRARFIIVGDGVMRREALEFANRLHLSDRILFTGRSASVGFWLARMDALMLLSQYEGMPNVLIEAQLAGTPVVTTPAGGAAETLVAGKTGYVLSSAEAPDLEEATQRLSTLLTMDPSQRRLMGEAARSWADGAFSVDMMLRRTVEVFAASYTEPMLSAQSDR